MSKAEERRLASGLNSMSMNCQEIMESKETTEDKETRSEQQDNMKNNLMEQTKIPQVRAIVERQDPSSKEVDDLTIRRFLRARDLDIGKASSMLLRYLKWRREFVPNGSVSLLETPNEVAQNKMFLQGSDKKGRPITVILGARHVQSKGGLEEFKRFVVTKYVQGCHQDKRNLLSLETLRVGDMQTAISMDTLQVYPFCRNITLNGLQRYSLCMLPTFLWQCGRLFILL
ncbi:hypothetical protein Peur_026399 [Populus x canadensis]